MNRQFSPVQGVRSSTFGWALLALVALSQTFCSADTLSALPEPAQPRPVVTPGNTTLAIRQIVPAGVFTGQTFEISIEVANVGQNRATRVIFMDRIPTQGNFIGSSHTGDLAAGVLKVDLGSLEPNTAATVVLTWEAPSVETVLANEAQAVADNGSSPADSASIQVGARTTSEGGVVAAGTALRNRSGGNIAISGIPDGSTITRAVLVWAILYSTTTAPAGVLTLDGYPVSADLTAQASGNLCWGDTATIGYASDVTAIAQAKRNGTYRVANAINGAVGDTLDAGGGPLPYTDGASLFVFYSDEGRQVKADFSYATNTLTTINIAFNDIQSAGTEAQLYLAGPDGQDAGEDVNIMGASTINQYNLFDGSDPIDGTPLSMRNLWDTDRVDVTGLLPAGQSTLSVNVPLVADCVGIGAAVLVVDQP